MTVVEFSALLAVVRGSVELAIVLARALRGEGCDVAGCPVDLEPLAPADIPTGEAGLAARARAVARSKGLDPATIKARLDADEL